MEPTDLFRGVIPSSVSRWGQEANEAGDGYVWTFEFNLIELWLYTDILDQPLSCELRDVHLKIPRRPLDTLRTEIRELLLNWRADKHAPGTARLKRTSLALLIIEALEKIALVDERFYEMASRKHAGPVTKAPKRWAASELTSWDMLLDNSTAGLDASTIADTASHILKRTPQDIADAIPSEWRVIHIESIMRPDLTARFLAYQAQLRNELENGPSAAWLRNALSPHSSLEGKVKTRLTKDEIVEDMLTPRVTFHGTPLRNVGSIIRHGFKKPGRIVSGKEIKSPRSGIVFDRGVYSSQEPFYAMSYAAGESQRTPVGEIPSLRLFVCATIMGRTYRRRLAGCSVHGTLIEGFDSHFDDGYEYIIYEETAMLPCYVVHLDLGSEEAKRALEASQNDAVKFGEEQAEARRRKQDPRLRKEVLSPGDVVREKQAKKAAAMKWFPYGFGPATGTKFVIQEVGEIDDDEEEYGDWQDEKHAFLREGEEQQYGQQYYETLDEDGNPALKRKGFFLDQYQAYRRGDGSG